MNYCSNCGTKIEANQNYCSNCGEEKHTTRKRSAQRTSGIAISGFVFGVLLLVAMIPLCLGLTLIPNDVLFLTSIIVYCILFVVSLILAVVGIIEDRQPEIRGRGLGITGIVLIIFSLIGIMIAVIVRIIMG